jgi:hypothetical protein
MKKHHIILLVTIINFLFIPLCKSQHLKPNSVMKANGTSFNIKTTGYNSLSVVNSKNVLYNKKPRLSQSALSSFEKTKKSGLLTAFLEVFNEARIKQLLPENALSLNYYVDPNGKVIEVSFLLNKNTLLTPTELEKLEATIKKNVSFKLLQNETAGGDFFIISQAPKYRNILDRTLE